MTSLIAALLLAAAAPAAVCKEATPGLREKAQVTCEQAQRSALQQVKDKPPRVRSAELEEEGGHLVYSFDIARRGRSGVDEVQVDAITGAIVSSKHESAAAEANEKD